VEEIRRYAPRTLGPEAKVADKVALIGEALRVDPNDSNSHPISWDASRMDNCPHCAELEADLAASRMRNSGLRAKIECLEQALAGKQTLCGLEERQRLLPSPRDDDLPLHPA
jgi:hypothetical protein